MGAFTGSTKEFGLHLEANEKPVEVLREEKHTQTCLQDSTAQVEKETGAIPSWRASRRGW
jgi:hypothetical protein